ncbi:MAG: alpha/beta fold hydrolase [Actinomycetota bacterium]
MGPPRHVFTVVDGLRLHHLDHGGEGRTILLVHGVLGNAWMWEGVADALARMGHVVAVDLRGYGDSQWSAEGCDPTETLASDMAGLADAHGWSEMAVVGFSLGGLVGLALWEKRPDLVERLVMVDLPPSSPRGETEVPAVQMTAPDHATAVEAERANLPHAPEELVEVMAHHGYRPGEGGELVRKHHPGVAERWRFRSEDWWPTLERFDRPLLFVHAPDSPVCPAAGAQRVADRAPRGRLVEVPDSGHLVPLEQPELFAGHVVGFLEEDR